MHRMRAPHRAAAPGDTSAARRMRTAAGSPASGAAACAFRNAHNASCSAVGPAPAASSARPAAPCGLASETAPRGGSGAERAPAVQRSRCQDTAGCRLDRARQRPSAAGTVSRARRQTRRRLRSPAAGPRQGARQLHLREAKRHRSGLSAHGGAPAAERQQRRCSGTRIDAPVERRHPESCAASAGVTSPADAPPDATTQSAMSPLASRKKLCTAAQGGARCTAARAARPWNGRASKWLARVRASVKTTRGGINTNPQFEKQQRSVRLVTLMRPRTSAP